MKKIIFTLCFISIVSILVLTSCSKSDELNTKNVEENVDIPNIPVVKTIPYSVTVSQNVGNGTKMYLDGSTYKFGAGDRLYITNTGEHAGDLYGYLTLAADDVGKSSGATFTGSLNTQNDFEPAADTPITGTLVSTSDAIHTLNAQQLRIESVTYPTSGNNSMAQDLNNAVIKFSHASDASTFGVSNFELVQNSSFLDFNIAFTGSIDEGDEVDITVTVNGNASDTRTYTSWTSVKPSTYVRVKFTTAYPAGTSVSSPCTVQLDWGGTEGARTHHATVTFNEAGTLTTMAANTRYNISKMITTVTIDAPGNPS